MPNEPRYVVAENWTHIFSPEFGEELTCWVYDRESSRVVDAKIAVRGVAEVRGDGTVGLKGGWRDAGDAERAEIEESVTIANSSCLEDPEEWDLEQTDELPEWATVASSPALGR